MKSLGLKNDHKRLLGDPTFPSDGGRVVTKQRKQQKHGPICPIASYATDQPFEPPQRMEECFAQFIISGWKPMSALPRGVAFAPNVAQIRREHPSEPD